MQYASVRSGHIAFSTLARWDAEFWRKHLEKIPTVASRKFQRLTDNFHISMVSSKWLQAEYALNCTKENLSSVFKGRVERLIDETWINHYQLESKGKSKQWVEKVHRRSLKLDYRLLR